MRSLYPVFVFIIYIFLYELKYVMMIFKLPCSY